MKLADIVEFWRGGQEVDQRGRWTHHDDREVLNAGPHRFNLDYPVSPYVGNVLKASVVILNANAGYKSTVTPGEFLSSDSIRSYLDRVDGPDGADWSRVSPYYNARNYGGLIANGRAVVVNACAYRSPELTKEPDNQKIIKILPSSIFVRTWLLEAVLPLARKGERLIVLKRWRPWHLPTSVASELGVIKDRAPVNMDLTGDALSIAMTFRST